MSYHPQLVQYFVMNSSFVLIHCDCSRGWLCLPLVLPFSELFGATLQWSEICIRIYLLGIGIPWKELPEWVEVEVVTLQGTNISRSKAIFEDA